MGSVEGDGGRVIPGMKRVSEIGRSLVALPLDFTKRFTDAIVATTTVTTTTNQQPLPTNPVSRTVPKTFDACHQKLFPAIPATRARSIHDSTLALRLPVSVFLCFGFHDPIYNESSRRMCRQRRH
jgi:hypothetical protein